MEQISLTIDGKKLSCRPGTSILEAATENGIRIPTLCHHPHLAPIGACRLCIVEDEKGGRLWASCVRLVAEGMEVRTDSPTIRKHRTNIVRMMMANHPESCIVCNQGNRCELRQIAAELGMGETGLYPMPYYARLEAANPFIIRDLSKCILCAKCIRADHELVMVGAIDYNLRGFHSRPSTAHERPLEASSCTFCGTCVSMCPTGALLTKNTRYVGTPQRETPTVCGFCGVGCALVMGSVDDQVVEVNPSHEDETVNESTLCVRGHFAHDFLMSPERLTQPLIREDGELTPASWEDALDLVSERLTAVKNRDGPQSIAFYGSSKCSLEENYLFQKIARVILETNSVDNGGYASGRAVMRRIHERLGGGGRVMPLRGLEKAGAVLVLGANPTHSLPVVGYYLKRASRMKGIPIIVVDPRKTELVPFSSLWLPLSPHTDSEFIHGLAALLYKRNAIDGPFIRQHTEQADQYFESLSGLDPEDIYRPTGLPPELMERAADLMACKPVAFVVGHGILQQQNGLQAAEALLNLALMTGNLGTEGAGVYVLAAENNEIGAWDMGTVPDFLPGRQSLADDMFRKQWERAWATQLSPDPGLNIIRMMEEAEEGNLKALYIMGENPLRSLPQPGRVLEALENLEFLVVQDILNNETTSMAHVVLPGAAFSEKEGAFTNLEGRVQCFEPVVPPPGEAKSDWEILDLLGSRMGMPAPYGSIRNIREEIGKLIPMYGSLAKNTGVSWIDEKETPALFHPGGQGGKIPFSPMLRVEDEAPDDDYPVTAILGSSRYHLGSGTRTERSERIADFALKGEVEISGEDGARLGLNEGDTVRISSPYGSIERDVKLERTLRPGCVFVPRAFHKNDARKLFALTNLEALHSPGFKEIRVKIEKG
jgi:formate dehydrogenase alpha subunit